MVDDVKAAPVHRSGDALLDFLHIYRLPAVIWSLKHAKIVYANNQHQAWKHAQADLDEQIQKGLQLDKHDHDTNKGSYQLPQRLHTTIKQKQCLWTVTRLDGREDYVLVLAQDNLSDSDLFDATAAQHPQTTPHIRLPWREQQRFKSISFGGGEMGERVRNFDWSKTELGPLDIWPQSRVDIVGLILHSPMPMTAYIGPKACIIYNDAYRSVLGNGKHPRALGKTAFEIWHEIWDAIETPLANTLKGEAYEAVNHLMFWQRLQGLNEMEEVWANWCYIPVWDGDSICANLHILYERSGHSDPITKRRLSMLAHLSERTGSARTFVDLCRFACEALSENANDLPYCLAYKAMPLDTVEEQSLAPYVALSSAGSVTSFGEEDRRLMIFALQETVGVEFGSLLAPERVIADKAPAQPKSSPSPQASTFVESSSPWSGVFSQVLTTKETVVVDDVRHLLGDVKARGIPGIKPYRAVCLPLLEPSGAIAGCFVVLVNPALAFDATFERFIYLVSRQLQVALSTVDVLETETQRAEGLAFVDRAKTSFFTSVSHELRTPLTLILGPLKDVLADKSLSQNHSNQLTMVHRNARRLLRLVNSILDFARAEAGRMQASFAPVALGVVTAELAASFQLAAETAKLDFRVLTEADKDQLVWSDLESYEKIVYNLLSNALKFTSKGSVTLKTWTDTKNFYLMVRDTGIGIPSDQLSSIFDKFHRVQTTEAKAIVGSGIGLSLTLELVKLHGGKMSVDSVYKEGTTFTIRIPLGCDHLPKQDLATPAEIPQRQIEDFAASVAEETALWATATQTEFSDESPGTNSSGFDLMNPIMFGPKRKPSVLVCDDNPDIRAYIRGILGKYCHITEAFDGAAGLETLENGEFDILLADIMMPKKDGFQLLKDVRASTKYRLLPVILLSARAGEDVGLDGLRAGADEYLVKPFSSKELLLRVQQHLTLGNIRLELEHRVAERTALLEESQGKYFRLCDYLSVGIHTSNVDGTVTWVNRRWSSVLGLLDDESWQNWAELIHPDDRERAVKAFDYAISNRIGYSDPVEMRLADKTDDGQYMDIIYDLQAELDASGNLTGYIGVFQDITSLRKLERERVELERSKRQQAEASRAMQERFIDMTCHELRNPLNAISNLAELLGESLTRIHALLQQDLLQPRTPEAAVSWGQVSEDLNEDLESVRTIVLCARHQKRIADDVLSISKLHGNLIQLVSEDFDPVLSIHEVMKMFELETNAKDITAVFVRHPSLDQYRLNTVFGDGGRFTQIIVNLLSNAIRFTEKAPKRVIRVSLGVEAIDEGFQYETLNGKNREDMVTLLPALSDSATAKVTVDKGETKKLALHFALSDSGKGMTEEEKSRIFQRFVTADPKTYKEFGGIGLGLWISKRLVELQGGKIDLQSIKGVGTILRFFIVVSPGSLGQSKSEHSSSLENQQSPPTTFLDGATLTPQEERYFDWFPIRHVPADRKPKILVVEDNIVNQKVLTRLLTNFGIDTTADDGVDCLEKIEASLVPAQAQPTFDLVLMDLEMPRMDGMHATAKIREAEKAHRYPAQHLIVAVSANSRDTYVQTAGQVGMQGYLKKPYSKSDLQDLLAKFIIRTG